MAQHNPHKSKPETQATTRAKDDQELWENYHKAIRDKEQAIARQQLLSSIHNTLNEAQSFDDAIARVLAYIKEDTGFDAVGIRLEKDKDYPYYIQQGFNEEFVWAENTLQVEKDNQICKDPEGNPLLECTCGLIIRGKTDPANPLFSPGGSAWTNNALPFLDVPAHEDDRLNPRNRCIHEGYLSIALIPVKNKGEIFGLLQLNDKQANRLSEEMIQFYEGVAISIGSTLKRMESEKKLRDNESFLSGMLENIPSGVGIYHVLNQGEKGSDYIIRHFNKYSLKIENKDLKEVVGKSLADLRPNIDEFGLIPVLKRVWETGEPEFFPSKIYVDQNFSNYYENTVFKLPTGEVVAVYNDVTERKKIEEAMRRLEIREQSAQLKQNFLANMSHEIRTPLTGVLGMIEILEQTSLNDQQKDYTATLRSSGENLREIINQVLDYSKMEAGKIELKSRIFEFQTLLEDSKALFENIIPKGVEFTTYLDPQIPHFISADRNRLLQVINNLVSNAIKFTHKGYIAINSRLLNKDEQSRQVTILMEVIDTGIGISESRQKDLFAPFSQVDENDVRQYEGTGLGLTICKELVKLHGGEIGLNSEKGNGSTFWFTFKATQAYRSEKTILPQKPRYKPLQIMLVEDKLVNQKVAIALLGYLGHKIHIANNGQQALEKYVPGKFDLILMDIQMPVMDGITAVKKLRETYAELPPIIGLSANAFEGDREKYLKLGMDDYLTKPFSKDDFTSIMEKWFKPGTPPPHTQ